jgi:hypothetical protein
MVEYESRMKLYDFLSVPDMPHVHWIDGAGWIMAECMYNIIKEKHKSMLAAANFIAMTTDKTTAVDNCSYIVVHAYLLQNWSRVP